MKYLKSTTQKEYVFSGRHIPKCVTKDNDVLTLNDNEYTDLLKITVVKSLIDSGAIIVLDEAPQTPTQQARNLTQQVARLTMENTQLHEEIKKLQDKASESDEVAALKAALKEQQDLYAQLKAEAEETIAKLQKGDE